MSGPELSVVMLTADGFPRLLASLRRLAADADAHRVEVVVVAPSAAGVDPQELTPFAAHRVVALGALERTGDAFAAGVRAASAPVVGLLEDHAFVRPGWAGAVIAAHAGGWGAVGHTMVNANPATAVSWGAFLTDFGSVAGPVPAGPDREVGWHQTSYRRERLVAFGPGLGDLLEAEGLLHAALAAEGERTYLAADAVVAHANVERLRDLAGAAHHGGRLFAGLRARGLPRWKRVLHALTAPGVPLLRGRALLADHARVRAEHPVPALALPYGAVALLAHAAGEVRGYLTGEGDAVARKTTYELDRGSFVARGLMDPPPRPTPRPPQPTPAPPPPRP